jgi:hypothetical protein
MSKCNQSIVNGLYTWYCGTVRCECTGKSTFCGGPGGSFDFSTVLNTVTGTFKFTCQSGKSECLARCKLFTISRCAFANIKCVFPTVSYLDALFPDGLSLPGCQFGECALPSDNPADIIVTILKPPVLTEGQKIIVIIASVFIGLGIIGKITTILYIYFSKFNK